MFLVFVYGVLHYFNIDHQVISGSVIPETGLTVIIGAIGIVLCFILLVCTGMIYACLKFLQEWYSPLTVMNYILLGMASGFTLATAYAASNQSGLYSFYALWAIIFTLAAFISRSASLIRNGRIKYKSNLRTAIGVRHNQIQQTPQGAMGGSYNTREFFHGKTLALLKSVK